MKYLLITASICWADEFDCEIFGVYTDEQWKKLCADTKKFFKAAGEVEVCFGTNEELQFSDYKDWSRQFTKKEITEEQYNFLLETFGENWGTGSGAFEIGDREIDEDADDEDYED